ncbi:MAG: restriction endonuclease [Spirochaetes bacterium]|nr:restriction endonuclease [Spirochaetota bacterium]
MPYGEGRWDERVPVESPGGPNQIIDVHEAGCHMLVPSLIVLLVVLIAILAYVYILAPRLNPLNRADGYIRQNMVDEAIMEYKKILDANPNDFTVHWKLAQIYYGRNQVDEGVLHLEEIMRIGKFNYEIEKAEVERKLGAAYLVREDVQKAFQNYFDILKTYPGDEEALYHVAFVLLGQGYFEQALRYFERLIKVGERDFEIYFGAGIASYQVQKTVEPVEYFRDALALNPRSDIANLAMAFAQQKKRDFKEALERARAIIDNSDDEEALFIARRLYGILCVQAKKPAEGVKMLEWLLELARKKEMVDEVAVILYDLGFAALHAEMKDLAYDYWNQLYQFDRGFINIQYLTTQLRKEMDAAAKPGAAEGAIPVIEYTDDWLAQVFPPNYLFDICGLKAVKAVDLGGILAAARYDAARDDSVSGSHEASGEAAEKIGALLEMDAENFRIIANRAVAKLGYRVDEILPTYREGDGVDFLAFNPAAKEKALVWVRRWKDLRVSEIPLRNLAQAVNDMKVKQGVFITTCDLTDAGEAAAQRLSKVKVVYPQELGNILAELI